MVTNPNAKMIILTNIVGIKSLVIPIKKRIVNNTYTKLLQEKQMNFEILTGDNRDTLKTLADNSVDAIVTDPPYGIDFLGKDWDANTGALGRLDIDPLPHQLDVARKVVCRSRAHLIDSILIGDSTAFSQGWFRKIYIIKVCNIGCSIQILLIVKSIIILYR